MRTAGGVSGGGGAHTSSDRSSNCVTTSTDTPRRSEACLPKVLEVRVGDARDALDRFEAAWNRRTEGIHSPRLLSPGGFRLRLRTLAPERWGLLERLREAG